MYKRGLAAANEVNIGENKGSTSPNNSDVSVVVDLALHDQYKLKTMQLAKTQNVNMSDRLKGNSTGSSGVIW